MTDRSIASEILEEYRRRRDLETKEENFRKQAKEAWTAPPGPEPSKEGEIAKEVGISAGALQSQNLVQAAQAVARKLGRNGAVTIDDVVHEMRRMGYVNVGPGAKDAPKNWKGSVFSGGEWVCTGSMASREASAHGRHVRQWCLKSWLRENPVNGTDNEASAFSLFRVYEDAEHRYPDGRFVFVIGRDMLSNQFGPLLSGSVSYGKDGRVKTSNKTLYGKEVLIVAGIGAIAIPESQRWLYEAAGGKTCSEATASL